VDNSRLTRPGAGELNVSYQVKEIFYTLQGEGANAGRPAVFCRFAGCNLWSGREEDRVTAQCRFCDTDFVGTDGTSGGKYSNALALVEKISAMWPPADTQHRFVVLTGGEPLLQVDEPLIAALHEAGFRIAVETNGTVEPPPGIDWLCVSPKAGAAWVLKQGHELKLVWPQPGFDLNAMSQLSFEHHYLQPMDGPLQAENIDKCITQCMVTPAWKLSIQTHKMTGIR
jgi:7-carboxy-7-deazaguanine synthase